MNQITIFVQHSFGCQIWTNFPPLPIDEKQQEFSKLKVIFHSTTDDHHLDVCIVIHVHYQVGHLIIGHLFNRHILHHPHHQHSVLGGWEDSFAFVVFSVRLQLGSCLALIASLDRNKALRGYTSYIPTNHLHHHCRHYSHYRQSSLSNADIRDDDYA